MREIKYGFIVPESKVRILRQWVIPILYKLGIVHSWVLWEDSPSMDNHAINIKW